MGKLLAQAAYGLLWTDKDGMSPRAIVVPVTINHEVASIIAAVWIGVNDFDSVFVSDHCGGPIRIALALSLIHI